MFAGGLNTPELVARAKDIVPLEDEKYKVIETAGTVAKFRAKILANIENENEFIHMYSVKNNETLRIHTINKHSKYYRCKHKTRYENTMDVEIYLQKQPSARIHNTNCPFSLAIKPSQNPDFNVLVEVEWNHNHSTTSLHSLTFKDLTEETKLKLEELFHVGLLPGAVHKELTRQIRSECSNDLQYEEKLADRAIIPRRPNVNRLY